MQLNSIQGMTPALLRKLKKLQIQTLQDLLFYLPIRYQNRSDLMPLGEVREGMEIVVEGIVVRSEIQLKKRRQWIVQLADKTGRLEMRFFHFNQKQVAQIKPNMRCRCFGEVRRWNRHYSLIHPEYQLLALEEILPLPETLMPIYAVREGITQKQWIHLIREALKVFINDEKESEDLPQKILKDWMGLTLKQALLYIHNPPLEADLNLLNQGRHPAQQRLAFEELLAHYLSLRKLRKQYRRHQAPILFAQEETLLAWLQALPFTLTQAQQRVWKEIKYDLNQPQPMMRLIQGDVGCGKTVLAGLAAWVTVQQNYQVAILVPTDLLAEQYLQQFKIWFNHFSISVEVLSARLLPSKRSVTLKNIESGAVQIVMGTHALFQKSVQFKQLGLIIVDEQHRFGVDQRLALREKGKKNNRYPHQLIMSATPIPRTLAMTHYADLDISIIDELPPGRLPVETVLIQNSRRQALIQRIQRICQTEHQAVYWVCPLIEKSERLQYEAVQETEKQLKVQWSNLTIGLLHGRMPAQEKERVMEAFIQNKINILVSTTVIEVGVDVPQASVIVIENPERLGLAQLHQLRGRVGRGQKKSYCILLYSGLLSEAARSRLCLFRETQDGFQIAQKDLEIRGHGELFGVRQTGRGHYRIANFGRDRALLQKVKATALWIEKEAIHLMDPLIQRWIYKKEDYIDV